MANFWPRWRPLVMVRRCWPGFIVADALAAHRLVLILTDWAPPPIWLTLYYPPYPRLPPRVAAFSDFFESMMRSRPRDTAPAG